jgi:hypothetical protein
VSMRVFVVYVFFILRFGQRFRLLRPQGVS